MGWLKHKMVEWLRYHTGEPPIWVQFREMGRHKGDHLHLYVWVPPHLTDDFEKVVTGWLTEKATTAALDAKTLRIEPITPGDTLAGLRSYGLKEAPLAVRLGLVTERHHTHKATGQAVAGQRLRLAEAIDRKARRDAGYVDLPATAFANAERVVPFSTRTRMVASSTMGGASCVENLAA